MNTPTIPVVAKLTSATFTALALCAAAPALADGHEEASETSGEEPTEMTEGEERLAELLEGRVAGEPQTCIRSRLNDRLTVIDGTAYVYGRGRTIYVQRTQDPEDIDRHDTLVSRRFNGSQICKLDIMQTIDPVVGTFNGVVFFEDFIPYTRVDNSDG